MLRNRLYYSLKPLLPWSVRMSLRRWFALRKRERVREAWPIVRGSECLPANWPGWPEGRKFAFILTHEVEGPVGLEKVKRLAELEMSLGFRSCFNFVPEGEYKVSSELRHWLVNNGFEVGVHDLKHDGHLFSSRRGFDRAASRINFHLREWDAVGFRSGFMLRNLEWLHGINLQYDCSTFDTDPFEPQPEGQNTIFPFWVPNPNPSSSILHPPSSAKTQPGYVELPYTLPQDFTLFLLLKEKNPSTWVHKFDWLATHGGMALLNVHPDYVQFEGESASARTYPVEYFVQFLKHAQSCDLGQFWQPLPKEAARYFRQTMLKPKVVKAYDQQPQSKGTGNPNESSKRQSDPAAQLLTPFHRKCGTDVLQPAEFAPLS